MRHTVATLMLSAGVPAHVVQRRLGHAKIEMTLTKRARRRVSGMSIIVGDCPFCGAISVPITDEHAYDDTHRTPTDKRTVHEAVDYSSFWSDLRVEEHAGPATQARALLIS